ncbi:hypothetical protein [Roseicitreum antarcticum]|uniref:hypothetical protein n=1 Tax=Roseicitreum antarcticum TaxID=564137 RepID=UPI001CC21C77|nr:hypothetical protein [Roseicitreum antarcticum]
MQATLGSAVAGAAILGLFWLPAEYGIDPTGLGSVMGLTQMGEIKQQLYAEAEADDAALAAAALAPSPPVAGETALASRLDGIEAQLAAIAAVVGADQLAGAPPPEPVVAPDQPESAVVPEATLTAVAPAPSVSDPAAPLWRDEVSYTLAAGEGIEVKLVMDQGAVAEFEWTANGAVVNYDTHGDGDGNSISYEQGRAVAGQTGTLTAAFTGNHGWFWRNRTDAPVTVTLRTRGDYSEVRAP